MQGQTPKLQSAFNLFEPSLAAIKVNVIPLVALLFAPLVLIFVELGIIFLGGFIASFDDVGMVLGSLVIFSSLLVSLAAYLFILPATTAVQLQGAKGERMTLGQAFDVGKRFWLRYLGLSICMALIIGIGFLLFIIPGLFMLRRYILAPYYMVDHNLGVFDSLAKSAEDSKRFANAIWGLIGVQFLVQLCSFVPFGFIVSILYLCAPSVRYLEIRQAAGHHPAHPAVAHHHTPQTHPANS